MALLLLCMHLSTLLALHLVILYHLLILKILLKGLHPALVKHHLGVILGLVGCRGLTSGLVRHRGLGLLFTLRCKPAHTRVVLPCPHLHPMYIVQMLEAHFGCVSFMETFLVVMDAKAELPVAKIRSLYLLQMT